MIPADAPVLTRLTSFSTCLACAKKTGVEIGESPGYLDSPEAKKNRGDIWTGGDTLRAAIGQTSNVTPIQLATYAMTLANDGVRYKTHLVHSVRSYDGLTDTVVQPEVVSRADLSKEAIDTVRKGMVEVVKSGTASGSSTRAISRIPWRPKPAPPRLWRGKRITASSSPTARWKSQRWPWPW